MNQYKLSMLISLSLLFFKYVFALFLTLLIKTTDCFAKTTGWFSGITLKTILKLAELISIFLIPHWISIYLQHLRKSFINNSPPCCCFFSSPTSCLRPTFITLWWVRSRTHLLVLGRMMNVDGQVRSLIFSGSNMLINY